MKTKVYVETSVISYLTSRPSRDIVIAGHQQTTRDWWYIHRTRFDVVASQLVVQEASAGDPSAAQQRLAILEELELLAVTEEAMMLAQALVDVGPLPSRAAEDALHIAIAVTNGVEYLLTWNCKHLANASMRKDIDRICRIKGYESVVICTPEELLEG
jgi:predicted nucleic acid-binding protein